MSRNVHRVFKSLVRQEPVEVLSFGECNRQASYVRPHVVALLRAREFSSGRGNGNGDVPANLPAFAAVCGGTGKL